MGLLPFILYHPSIQILGLGKLKRKNMVYIILCVEVCEVFTLHVDAAPEHNTPLPLLTGLLKGQPEKLAHVAAASQQVFTLHVDATPEQDTPLPLLTGLFQGQSEKLAHVAAASLVVVVVAQGVEIGVGVGWPVGLGLGVEA